MHTEDTSSSFGGLDGAAAAAKSRHDSDCCHESKRHLLLGRKAMTNLDSVLKSRDITLLTKIHIVKAMVFPVIIYGCESWTDHKEGRALVNWCLQTVVLEKTLESPGHSKESNPTLNSHWKDWWWAPICWPPDAKSWLIGKDPGVGKDWRQKKKKATEDEMVGWHCRLNGHELEQTPGDSKGQGSLVCCSPWSHKESDTT